MKKLLLIPITLILGLRFTPNKFKAVIIGGIIKSYTAKSQTPLTKEDADTYYKPITYSPTLSAVQADGTPYLRVDDAINYENSVYTWNMVQDKPEFKAVAFSNDYRDLNWSPVIPSPGTGIIVNNYEWSVAPESQSLSITGKTITIKTGSISINSVTIPNITSGDISTALGASALVSETDPGVPSYVKSISSGDITSWNSKLSSQTSQTFAASKNITISSGANSFTIGCVKSFTTYSGSTNGSGDYTVTFSTAYSTAPVILPTIPNQSDKAMLPIVSNVSTTGFTINVFTRGSISSLPIIGALGSALLGAATTPVSSQAVDVTVIEK